MYIRNLTIEEELLFTCLKERANFFKDLQKKMKVANNVCQSNIEKKFKNPKKWYFIKLISLSLLYY